MRTQNQEVAQPFAEFLGSLERDPWSGDPWSEAKAAAGCRGVWQECGSHFRGELCRVQARFWAWLVAMTLLSAQNLMP